MRIALLAPLYECVPPATYGGTERVIYYLTEELVRRGHKVTLFASGGSQTTADLVEVSPRPIGTGTRLTDPVAYHVLQLGLALDRSAEFDLIHSHCDFRALPFVHRSRSPILSTNHNRLDTPETDRFVRLYPEGYVTALSKSQQRSLPAANWLGVCYNGIPVDEFPYSSAPGSYLAFVGRLSPEKGPLEAIEVAERTGIPLKIAAKINEWERDYFEGAIRPRLAPPLIEHVGELDERNKRQFLAGALALLFPIQWPEPFGMVMIESMATGTPVLAFPVGATSEIVDHGQTGFLCHGVAEMARRVSEVAELDRETCRRAVTQRFSARTMTSSYLDAYDQMLRQPRSIVGTDGAARRVQRI